MHDLNERIISKNGKLIYMTEGIARYLGNKKHRSIGFFRGKAEINDLKINIEVTDTILKIDMEVYGNKDIDAVNIDKQSENRNMEFVYNGMDIEFQFIDKQECRCRIIINGQWVDFSADRFTVLANDRNIRYFGDKDLNSDDSFDSYIIKGLSEEGIDLEDILMEDLMKGIDISKKEKSTDYIYIPQIEDYIKIFHESLNLDRQNYDEYTIMGRNTANRKMIFLIENINELNQILEKKHVETEISSPYRLLGMNETAEKLKIMLQKSAKTNTTIMITGESGTGKTFLAKEIHNSSRRSKANFIHVNCAAIPYSLVESELFGHEEGSFTGAKKGGKKGYFDLAEGGTVFLDEISEIPLELQGRLLEVIQSNTFYRVGGTQKIKSNIRLIVATNRDLLEMVSQKLFREDLYYRINVFPVELPPLRERYSDFKFIINTLLTGICIRLEMEPVIITNEAIEYAKLLTWKGNLRELENILERSVILSDSEIITKEVFEHSVNVFNAQIKKPENILERVREDTEAKLIRDALQRTGGNKKLAAQILGIGRTSLFEKIKKYDI